MAITIITTMIITLMPNKGKDNNEATLNTLRTSKTMEKKHD